MPVSQPDPQGRRARHWAMLEDQRVALRRQRLVVLLCWAVPMSIVAHILLVIWLAGLFRGGSGLQAQTVRIDLGPPAVASDAQAQVPDPPADHAPMPETPRVTHEGSDAPLPGPAVPDVPSLLAQTIGDQAPSVEAGGLGLGTSGSAGGQAGGETGLPTASFFGATASGRRFAFVIDLSGSMRGPRIEMAIDELCRAIAALPDSCSFRVVFYNSVVRLPDGPHWRRAQDDVVDAMCRDMRDRIQGQADSSTNPAPAFRVVLGESPRPDAIFFLTDGIIDPEVLNAPMVERMNLDGTPAVIHGIVFGDEDDRDDYQRSAFSRHLRRMVRDTGGSTRFVEIGVAP